MPKRNVAIAGFAIGNFILTATGETVTTGTPICKRTLDGTAGACANAAAYDADGLEWKIDLAAGDLNAACVGLSFVLTGCQPINFTILTDSKIVSDLNDISAGSAMTLTSAYDAAKTAAQASTALTNATWTDTKAGYLDASIAGVAAAVWQVGERTLSSFGTLVADVVAGVWGAAARTITGWTGGPTLANQESILAGIGAGAGTTAREYTLVLADLTTPIPDVKVDIYSSNISGAKLAYITSRTTDAWGKIYPPLADGYYKMVPLKAGFTFPEDLEHYTT